jgi:hypothetical protein
MTQTPLLWSLAVSIALTVSAARAEEPVRVNPSSVRSSTDTRLISEEQRQEKNRPAVPQGELPPPPPPSAPKP